MGCVAPSIPRGRAPRPARAGRRDHGLRPRAALNMLFGNSSLHAHVELVDVEFPPDFLARFPAPVRGGRDPGGLGVKARADLRGAEAAGLAHGGVSPSSATRSPRTASTSSKTTTGSPTRRMRHSRERVAACQRAIERARRETGRPVHLRAEPRRVPVRSPAVAIAQRRRRGAVLLAPALIGMPAFADSSPPTRRPGARASRVRGAARVDPPLLLGRSSGCSAPMLRSFPISVDASPTRATIAPASPAATANDWGGYPRSLPVPAGGLSVDRADESCASTASDTMLLIGGSLLAAAERMPVRTRASRGDAAADAAR